jgi:hypothetical protein
MRDCVIIGVGDRKRTWLTRVSICCGAVTFMEITGLFEVVKRVLEKLRLWSQSTEILLACQGRIPLAHVLQHFDLCTSVLWFSRSTTVAVLLLLTLYLYLCSRDHVAHYPVKVCDDISSNSSRFGKCRNPSTTPCMGGESTSTTLGPSSGTVFINSAGSKFINSSYELCLEVHLEAL